MERVTSRRIAQILASEELLDGECHHGLMALYREEFGDFDFTDFDSVLWIMQKSGRLAYRVEEGVSTSPIYARFLLTAKGLARLREEAG